MAKSPRVYFQCASLLMFPKVNNAPALIARQGRCG